MRRLRQQQRGVLVILRPYQLQMLAEAREHMRRGARRVLLVAPTGSGKRIMAVHAISTATARGKRSTFVVHRKELLNQSCASLDEIGLRHGLIQAGSCPYPGRLVQVASVQTLARRTVEPFDFLFIDEAHHARSATFEDVIAANPNAYVLGFTATPVRLDGRGLGKHFDAMVVGPSMRTLIEGGHLADYRIFAPPAPATTAREVAGDYDRGQLAADIDQPKIVGDVVAHYQRYAAGTQAIAFAVNILHSKHIAEALNAAGISARHADGETPAGERELIMRDFSAGRFRVLCNVDLLGEGLDVPGIETVICARPTASLTVWLQQVGRGLRVKSGGGRAIILDHAGNTHAHGLPDDDREWSLDDRPEAKRKPSEPSLRICPECFAALRAMVAKCECGHVFRVETVVPEHADGELSAIDLDAARYFREREQRMTRDLGDLIKIGMSRGYKAPEQWARHVWAARQRKSA